ncbi:MAG: FmdB family zinc ribbon protein [Candidatus Pacearchaeota archaeon]|jgi:putative FmdB family regulatory protein
MPIYEYQCPKCGIYERIQRELKDNDTCDCGGLAERIMSVPAVKTSKKSPNKPPLPSLGYSELICGE